MAHPLEGVAAKIDRGFEHIEELESETAAFLSEHRYHIEHKPEPDTGWYIGSFRIDAEPPVRLGVIVGEVFGQFRSALDHLSLQLILVNRRTSAGKSVFPIYNVKKDWDESSLGRRNWQRLVRAEHFAVLEELQPYHSGGSTPPGLGTVKPTQLSVIQWVANRDKHELVHSGYVSPTGSMGPRSHPNVAQWEWLSLTSKPLRDQTALYRVRFVDDAEIYVPFEVGGLNVTFGPPGKMYLNADLMRNFGGRIRGIVTRFTEITPEFA